MRLIRRRTAPISLAHTVPRVSLTNMKCAISRALFCLALSVAGCERSESNITRSLDSNARTSAPTLTEQRSTTQEITNSAASSAPVQTTMTDETAIALVQQWYRSNGYAIPPSDVVVVHSKTNEIWVLKVGPEARVATVRINSRTREVVQFSPGF
jgi:hypothetical protein